MGDPRKPRKAYQTPRHPWRKDQLEEELHLVGEYGLRNKRELRGHETELSQIRGIARTLLGAEAGERGPLESQYLKRLARLGILPESATVDNILDLNVKDLMERRLQTIVHRTDRQVNPPGTPVRHSRTHQHRRRRCLCAKLHCSTRTRIQNSLPRPQSPQQCSTPCQSGGNRQENL